MAIKEFFLTKLGSLKCGNSFIRFPNLNTSSSKDLYYANERIIKYVKSTDNFRLFFFRNNELKHIPSNIFVNVSSELVQKTFPTVLPLSLRAYITFAYNLAYFCQSFSSKNLSLITRALTSLSNTLFLPNILSNFHYIRNIAL